MMVSKVAVAALVLIVACPILLGFAMNLQQNTYTGYDLSGDSVDVTSLLKNSEGYNTASADLYTLNTNFVTAYDDKPVVPLYQKFTTAHTSLPFSTGFATWGGGYWDLYTHTAVYMLFDYEPSNPTTVTMEIILDDSTVIRSVSNTLYYYYDNATDSITYTYYSAYDTIEEDYYSGSIRSVNIIVSGSPGVDVYWGNQDSNSNSYVNISGGFRLYSNMTDPFIKLPEDTKSYLMTINLDSITESNYSMIIDDGYSFFNLTKTTSGGVVTWTCSGDDGDQEIYYDSSRTDNTYQYYIEATGKYTLDNRVYYTTHAELRYIGGWPSLIGEATAYMTYEHNTNRWVSTDLGFNKIRVYSGDPSDAGNITPILRMDGAQFAAFKFSIIKDKVYDPAAFKINPSTKLTNIAEYGAYITFGSVRFDVKDGKITLGNHKLPVKDLVFESVPTESGYQNKIGNTVISTSVTPSTLTFGGQWGMSVITDSLVEFNYSKTDWIPGHFGWNGIDQNFLMVGMLTAIGVFVGLGIYAKSHNMRIWPVLLVCGGAILLFFCMI